MEVIIKIQYNVKQEKIYIITPTSFADEQSPPVIIFPNASPPALVVVLKTVTHSRGVRGEKVRILGFGERKLWGFFKVLRWWAGRGKEESWDAI